MAIGVTHYSGDCSVCSDSRSAEIDALIRLDKHVLEVLRKHPHLVKRDYMQHRHQCLEAGDGQVDQRHLRSRAPEGGGDARRVPTTEESREEG